MHNPKQKKLQKYAAFFSPQHPSPNFCSCSGTQLWAWPVVSCPKASSTQYIYGQAFRKKECLSLHKKSSVDRILPGRKRLQFSGTFSEQKYKCFHILKVGRRSNCTQKWNKGMLKNGAGVIVLGWSRGVNGPSLADGLHQNLDWQTCLVLGW